LLQQEGRRVTATKCKDAPRKKGSNAENEKKILPYRKGEKGNAVEKRGEPGGEVAKGIFGKSGSPSDKKGGK